MDESPTNEWIVKPKEETGFALVEEDVTKTLDDLRNNLSSDPNMPSNRKANIERQIASLSRDPKVVLGEVQTIYDQLISVLGENFKPDQITDQLAENIFDLPFDSISLYRLLSKNLWGRALGDKLMGVPMKKQLRELPTLYEK